MIVKFRSQIYDAGNPYSVKLSTLCGTPTQRDSFHLIFLLIAGTAPPLSTSPFHFQDKASPPTMPAMGLVHPRGHGGHIWMNADMMVVTHPYYTATDETGRFEFTAVPPGTYQIPAWHQGRGLVGKEQPCDVLTQRSVQRPVFTEAKTWEKSVTVTGNQGSTVNFVISNGG